MFSKKVDVVSVDPDTEVLVSRETKTVVAVAHVWQRAVTCGRMPRTSLRCLDYSALTVNPRFAECLRCRGFNACFPPLLHPASLRRT